MKTFMQRKEDVKRSWYVVDASGIPLGRLASKIAIILSGKNKPTYTPHIDGGDNVIVLNASKVELTGKKLDDKLYYNHSGYPGGLRKRTAKTMVEKYPEEMVRTAIKGMLPKGALGSQMLRKLNVYAGNTHEHQAQKPEVMEIK